VQHLVDRRHVTALKIVGGGFGVGLAVPLVLFGLVAFGTGLAVGFRAPSQVASIESEFAPSPKEMVVKELPRDVSQSLAALVVMGLAVRFGLRADWSHGAGPGLILVGALKAWTTANVSVGFREKLRPRSLFVKLGPSLRHAASVRPRALILAGLLMTACEARTTSLGSVKEISADAGEVDAGLLRRAGPVGALSIESCRKQVETEVPSTCFGVSGPAPNTCVLAVTPDGGTLLAAAFPTGGDRSIRRVHGVDVDRIFLEVGDVRQRTEAELISVHVTGGTPVVHLTASATATFPAVSVRRGVVDALWCEPDTRCSLHEVSLDGGALTLLPNAPTPTPGSDIIRSVQGSRSWATDSGVALYRNPTVNLVTKQAGGWSAFDADDTLFVTEGNSLLRLPVTGNASTLSTTLSSPRGLFVVGGFVLVVEARSVRAFPKQGGASLALYELRPGDVGELTAPRLVDGRLIFDQVCEAVTTTTVVNGNVELDFTLGQARWLNDEPAFPFVRGARPNASGLRDVYVTPEFIVGLVD
jgi:hypothetical protein